MSSVPRATRSRSRKATALVASGVTLLAVTAVGFAPGTALASSHREAPLTAANPLEDNTDVYAFSSPDAPDTVTLIANWIPFEEPNGGPNFYPFGTGAAGLNTPNQGYTYDINIDSNGDGKANLVYRWTFKSNDTRGTNTFLYNNGVVDSLDSPNLLFKQTYDITVSKDGGGTFPITLLKDAKVAPSNVGPASMPNYDTNLFQAAVTPISAPGLPADGGQSYAGQADDPFFLDLRVFDLLYGGNLSEVGQDTLAGYNVNTVSLKLPKKALALNNDATKNPVIGVWSTTNRATQDLTTGAAASGTGVQVSRLGQPLVNEVVIPAGLKDTFNSIPPSQDAFVGAPAGSPPGTFGPVVPIVLNPEVPRLIASPTLYNIPAPTGDPAAGQTINRTDIGEIFLTGITKAFDGTGTIYSGPNSAFKAKTDKAPIGLDLNSQVLNKDFPQVVKSPTDPTLTPDVSKFLPSEMLRLNMKFTGPTNLDGTPRTDGGSTLGAVGGDAQGFPNGRRLTDDVVDIELLTLGGQFLGDKQNAQAKALAGAGGDKVGVNDKAFGSVFPYIASPHNSSVNKAEGGVQTVVAPAPTTTAAPAPTTNAGSGNGSGTNQGSVAPANGVRTPVGGVDTGAGGSTPTSAALPLVTGTAAVLLLAAGGASILSNRRKRAAAEDTTAE
jgi:hypothetical protein